MEKFSDDPELIAYVPENSVAFSQILSFNEFTTAFFYKYTGRQVRGTDYLGNPAYLPGYGLLSLNLVKYFTLNENSISAQLKFENLLNRQFQRIYGYPEPGRTMTLILSLKKEK